jgi:hypothetical protein
MTRGPVPETLRRPQIGPLRAFLHGIVIGLAISAVLAAAGVWILVTWTAVRLLVS